ncbi:heterokaryon incompatibility protein-domain-containing protein [Lasiosphaeria miniovina]|uniref:Heterokaryon incompatibility protein-domain-containing protein n=1 Tax=Lasiosphaeria miniovina TaxID=1954250 RepID=A0AA40DK63_9PEZI|nr:heterokaryon incompatibility protein-domain-containing protein [Lasiosphaeria miniovina]KAK0706160.1 heterokaryon incompatibility protein-domain-containing protein [Lasiosphaeria miniovina]
MGLAQGPETLANFNGRTLFRGPECGNIRRAHTYMWLSSKLVKVPAHDPYRQERTEAVAQLWSGFDNPTCSLCFHITWLVEQQDGVSHIELPRGTLRIFPDIEESGMEFSVDIMQYTRGLYQGLPRRDGRTTFTICLSLYADAGDVIDEEASMFLPTRVIVVNPPGLEGEGLVQLVETTAIHVGSYTILSHCWPWTLPPTFRDAVILTRDLGAEYLWIDSLCIVQDDPADWERESAKMGLYYHYATLVIAATGAQDSHGGLFEPRRLFARKTDMPIFDLPSFTEDGVQDGWFHMATMPSLQGTHPALSKLATRAWFYQEWALARRVAFFTPSQLVWRCQGEYRTEAIADEHTRDDYWEDEPEQCRHAYEIVNTKWDIGHFDNAQWMRDISEYNCRALTYELNRAHAFQGVANMFSQRYRPSYAFGHWVEDMPSSLLWSKPRSTGPNRFERRAEIPTWSCFSVSGPIEVDSIIFRNTEYLNDASKETAEESSGSSSHTREVAWISPYKEKIIGSVTAAEKQLNIKSSALLLERAVAPTSNALCYVLRPFNPDATIPASTTPGPSVLGQRGQNPYNYRRLGLLDYDIRWGNPELPREILPGVLNVPKHGICLDIAQEESPSHMLLVLIQEAANSSPRVYFVSPEGHFDKTTQDLEKDI